LRQRNNVTTSPSSTNRRDVQIVIGMSRTLADDITALQRQSSSKSIQTFLHYKKVREN